MSAVSRDNPRHLPRPDLGLPRQPIRSTSQILGHQTRHLQRQLSFDGLRSVTLEPSAKRQKVDIGSAWDRGEWLNIGEENKDRKRIHDDGNLKIPPFPSRPGTHSQRSSSAPRTPSTRETVQSKPYTLETPKAAPQYGHKGMWI
jgi:hypothetical protein